MNALAPITIEPADTIGDTAPGIVAYQPFRTQLAEFKASNAQIVFDYESPKGNKEARSHVFKLRQAKAAVDKARMVENRAYIDYKKRIDAEAYEIIDEIEAMIAVHTGPLEEIEMREKRRVDYIKSLIQHIVDCGNGIIGGDPYPYPILFRELEEKITIDKATFGEFELEAMKARDQAMAKLKTAFEEHQKREAERAELERLRAEAAEREQRERDEQIRREAAETARRAAESEAEQKRLAEEKKAKAEREAIERQAREEREAAEKRELELKLQAERAQREKAEAEKREAEAIEAERQRVQKEAEAKASMEAKRQANEKHRNTIHHDVIAALTDAGLTPIDAQTVLTAIRDGRVPHVGIAY